MKRALIAAALAAALTAAVAIGFPPVSVESVGETTITVGGLDCNARYEIRVRERRNKKWRDARKVTRATDACPEPPPPPPTTTSTTTSTTTTTTPPPPPPPSGDCDLNATTANFASQVAATAPGQVLCLASGTYGDWSGVSKGSPGITIREQAGASATFSDLNFKTGAQWFTMEGLNYEGGNWCGPANNVTVKNATQTGYLQINPGVGPSANNSCTSAPAMVNSNVTLDGIDATLSACPSGSCLSYEGRITFAYGSASNTGVTIKNSRLHGNCADGIQFVGPNAGRVTIGPGNEFYNLFQGSCGPHVDAIQYVSGGNTRIVGNYFHDNTSGVVDYDGQADNMVVEKNVFLNTGTGGTPALCFGGGDATRVEHNVFRGSTIFLCVNHSGQPQTNVIWRNNIQDRNPTVQGAGTFAVNDYNLCTSGSCAGTNSLNGNPTYAGGANPTTYAGWFLAAGSLGQNAGSDGQSMGLVP